MLETPGTGPGFRRAITYRLPLRWSKCKNRAGGRHQTRSGPSREFGPLSIANAEMPFVAVIGGLWQLDQVTAGAARDAGKAIGAELAKAGFGLVVYFSNDEFSSRMWCQDTRQH